ncbi:MAG: peptide chain release factor 2 [Pseudomonadota bacterium]
MTIIVDDLQQKIRELDFQLGRLGGCLDLDAKKQRLAEVDSLMSRQEVWSDLERQKTLQRERKGLQQTVAEWENAKTSTEEAALLLEMAVAESDAATVDEVRLQLKQIEPRIQEMELRQVMSDENDPNNAIVLIHSGAGGTEAQDWTQMLLRMYLRWAERHSMKSELFDEQPGEEAGIKGVTFMVRGPYAYGYLRGETGVHRLVRISPFDASGRRHTSFASVFVYPEIDEQIVIDVKESDLRVDTFRASGAGGQHVNKTSSAVRITHLPTGIVVQCQNEKSQHRNRDIAMKVLRSRLYDKEREEQARKKQELHDNKKDIAWGSQIRSYVLQPYRLVKDHRTSEEMGNVDAVLDGFLDPFVQSYLHWASAESRVVRQAG